MSVQSAAKVELLCVESDLNIFFNLLVESCVDHLLLLLTVQQQYSTRTRTSVVVDIVFVFNYLHLKEKYKNI